MLSTFFCSPRKTIRNYVWGDPDNQVNVGTTTPRNLHEDVKRLENKLQQMRSLPQWDEAGPAGKLILLLAGANQYLTRAGAMGLIGDILLPGLDTLVDGLSPAVMFSLLALDTPDPEFIGLWSQRIGYGWTAANLVWHLWHRHRNIAIQFVEETVYTYGRCMRNLVRVPLWGLDYMLRFMRWNSRRVAEFCLTYIVTHMFADENVGLIQQLERMEFTALEFFAEALGIAVPVLALILLRQMNVPAWQREAPPFAVQILDRAMQRVPIINSALAFAKRHPSPFSLAHASGQFAYNTAIFHTGFSAVYFLGILVIGHNAGLEEKLIAQGITFIAFSFPAGGATTMTMYVLGTDNCCVHNNRIMTHATQQNLNRLGNRAVNTVPRITVPLVSIAIMTEYLVHGIASEQDGIIAASTMGGVFVLAAGTKVTADVLKTCLNLSREAAIEHAKDHGERVEIGEANYDVSYQAGGYIRCILDPDIDVSNLLIDPRSPGFTPHDLDVIELAWAERRKYGLKAYGENAEEDYLMDSGNSDLEYNATDSSIYLNEEDDDVDDNLFIRVEDIPDDNSSPKSSTPRCSIM